MAPPKTHLPDVPPVICDEKQQKYYTVGEFLGKGGFAACYKVSHLSGEEYAAKVVSKHFIKQKHEKATQLTHEIKIHKSIQHENIVKLFCAFEDRNNIYILMELCARRSMMELQRRRKAITEPELRYFTRQISNACIYIHSLDIIHRDLKLGNLFITDNMVLKLGDFGLATNLLDGRNDKRWLCGTPNYIAPEVLQKKPHTTKIDIWAIGCIVYVLLVGKPPFETSNLEHTYRRITRNHYDIPEELSPEAKELIKKLLAPEPVDRPTAEEILKSSLMQGFTPQGLPLSCLTTKPVFAASPEAKKLCSKSSQIKCNVLAERTGNCDMYLNELEHQLSEIFDVEIAEKLLTDNFLKDPASVPIYWVSRWVDYSEHYAFAYQLCDGSHGAAFNDRSKFIMDVTKEFCQYRSPENEEIFFTVSRCPKECERKLTLLQYFESYMTVNLKKTGAHVSRDGVEIGRLPVLQHWLRTKSTVSFMLSNGTFQINFNVDHSKIIICPLMGAATYIDPEQNFHTYKLNAFIEHGAPKEVTKRLQYALGHIRKIQNLNKPRQSQSSTQVPSES